jgi:hypothetical protein
MVDVRVTDGELTVWWPTDDQPVANLNGHWRGPCQWGGGHTLKTSLLELIAC